MVNKESKLDKYELLLYKSQIKTNRWMIILGALTLVLTLLIAASQIIFVWYNNDVYEQTTRPNLNIVPDAGFDQREKLVVLNKGDIARINGDNLTGASYLFIVTNTGKMESDFVNIRVLNNWSSSSSYAFTPNVLSGQSESVTLFLTTKECYEWQLNQRMDKGNRTACIESRRNIPSGEHPLQLEIRCTNCKYKPYYLNLSACFKDVSSDCLN